MKTLYYTSAMLFFLNVILLISLLFIEYSYSNTFHRFEIISANNVYYQNKINISDSDDGLFESSSEVKAEISKDINPKFLLPEQSVFWSRLQYSILAAIKDEPLLKAFNHTKNIKYYNSGFFNNMWMSELYSPIRINNKGLLDLEILFISWVLSDFHYKITVQYDFYITGTDKRHLEHVVNIIIPR